MSVCIKLPVTVINWHGD